jgi:D-alanyl-lipoteichoic acid acyltransferase DltB (MBOAT superfamily)
MSFASLAFVVFYPTVLVLYYLLAGRRGWQNALLLAASCFFYGWWDWRFLGLLFFTALLDFAAAQIIVDRPRWRRAALLASIGANLGVLFTFKYFDFFALQLDALLSALGLPANLAVLDVVLPIGISFYTFQSMAYTIDVYRGAFRPERDPLVFLAFVSFFPQLVAGPIQRAPDLLPQFRRDRSVTRNSIRNALWLIVWGFFLKLVVGDSAALIADAAFRPDQEYGWSVIFGTLAFGVQIYGDFCGYSYIAKGTAALLGFDIVWNFRQPYWSTDVREFWQRWHISLSRWLRDYLYISLGGNRRGRARTGLNLMLTMTLGGLWHGAGWNFLFWGVWHGAALVVHRVYDGAVPQDRRLPPPLAWALTMLVVFTGWFFFRARSWELLAGMSAALSNLTWMPAHGASLRALLVALAPVVIVERLQLGAHDPYVIPERHPAAAALANAACVLAIIALLDRARAQFIYFQF